MRRPRDIDPTNLRVETVREAIAPIFNCLHLGGGSESDPGDGCT